MVEIIPRREERIPPIVNVLFIVSLVLAVVAAGGFFILKNLQEQRRGSIQNMEQRLLAEPSADQKQLEEDVLGFKQKLDDFKVLADGRRTPLPLFAFLETSVHPAAVFTGLTVNLEKNKILLAGETDSFKHLDEQILLLRRKSEVQDLQLEKIQLGEQGRVEFSVGIMFPPEFTKKIEAAEQEAEQVTPAP